MKYKVKKCKKNIVAIKPERMSASGTGSPGGTWSLDLRSPEL